MPFGFPPESMFTFTGIPTSLLALRKYNESGIARGTVIALSLVFLINAICGIGWMH